MLIIGLYFNYIKSDYFLVVSYIFVGFEYRGAVLEGSVCIWNRDAGAEVPASFP